MIGNGQSIALTELPQLPMADFAEEIVECVAEGQRVVALFAMEGADKQITLYSVLAEDRDTRMNVATAKVDGELASITPRCPQVHLFEREMVEQFGIKMVGHPWLKPVRFPTGSAPIGEMEFYRVAGDQIHEVAVGPVHAGIIEPGHFRFQCHGEEVFHLEISLGYQHRGVERALIGGPNKRSIHYAETLAGDTTVGHATAYCELVESLSHARVPARAQAIRGIALELERLANHVGDLGAMAGDVGFLPTMSFCGRIRGDFLNMTALICGNRFGRGMIKPGGVGFDIDPAMIAELLKRLEAAKKDCHRAIELLWDSPSAMSRFEETGRVSGEMAGEIGLVGPAARACGIARDVRNDHPSGIYRFAHIPISTVESGDVYARAYVRWLEVQRSIAFVEDHLHAIPGGGILGEVGPLVPNQLCVSLVEGWRGEICHVGITDSAGKLSRYKIVDPSFHNWTGLAIALRNQQISDFPLCNKSFNLSYCGHDL